MKHLVLFESFLNEETIKGEGGLSLNVQHEYITLKTPRGNYTASYSGAKASGELASIPGAFKALDNYVHNKEDKRSLLDRFKDLLKPSVMDKLVPGWDKPAPVDELSPGDKVKFKEAIFVKKYPDMYEVHSVKKTTVYLKVSRNTPQGTKVEIIGFPKYTLEKAK